MHGTICTPSSVRLLRMHGPRQVQKSSPHQGVAPFNQWAFADLVANIEAVAGAGAWASTVWPQIKALAADAAFVLPPSAHRDRSFELFGLDVLLSQDLTAHLIEVNRGPGLHMITDVVRPLYPNVRAAPPAPARASASRGCPCAL